MAKSHLKESNENAIIGLIRTGPVGNHLFDKRRRKELMELRQDQHTIRPRFRRQELLRGKRKNDLRNNLGPQQ
jgi:hypothetical protein